MEVGCSQVDCKKSVDFDRQVVAEELDKQAEDCQKERYFLLHLHRLSIELNDHIQF